MVTQSDDSSKKQSLDSESNNSSSKKHDSDSESIDSPAFLIKIKFSESNVIQLGYAENNLESFLVEVERRLLPGHQLQPTLKPGLTDANAKKLYDLLDDQGHAIQDHIMPSNLVASVREVLSSLVLETHEEKDLGDASQSSAGEDLSETNSESLDVESLSSCSTKVSQFPKRYHKKFTKLDFF